MPLHAKVDETHGLAELNINPVFCQEVQAVPRNHLPLQSMAPDTALQIIRDELILDGNARLNLATFVTTWMEPQAELLMHDCLGKNMIDKDEYPQTAELEHRCVNILSNLWHAPTSLIVAGGQTASGYEDTGEPQPAGAATGCSTTGSSEAAMLGGLALLWRWRERRRAAGLPVDRPNMVMGSNVQVCWEKFCRYWEVEPRYVPMSRELLHMGPVGAVAKCDENTIGVVAVMGSTMDGSYEPVQEISLALDALHVERGFDV